MHVPGLLGTSINIRSARLSLVLYSMFRTPVLAGLRVLEERQNTSNASD